MVLNSSGVVTTIANTVQDLIVHQQWEWNNQACPFNGINPGLSQTYYHNGSGATPVAGDNCFLIQQEQQFYGGGYYNINSATGLTQVTDRI